MYDFTGCECPICHQHFKPDSDIVVCPDCGAPYHRDCYASLGHCKYEASHSDTFEWKAPQDQLASSEVLCPQCGEKNPKTNTYCGRCGILLGGDAPANTAHTPPYARATQGGANAASKGGAQYHYHTNAAAPDAAHAEDNVFTNETVKSLPIELDPNTKISGIPAAEWATYIGNRSITYLPLFTWMEKANRKHSFSFSALLFGPLYFFYRKVWGYALLFSLVTLICNIPSILTVLIYSESVYAPAISEDTLFILSNVMVAVNWAVMMLRGLYGFHLYKEDAAKKILKLKAISNDPKSLQFRLRIHGGTSIGAVILAVASVFVLAAAFSNLLGPNIDAVTQLLY